MDFSLEPLEYDRLKTLLRPYVRSSGGRDRLERLKPTTDKDRLQAQHALNREAMAYLRDHGLGFGDIDLLPSVVDSLGLAGVTLAIEEVEAIIEFLSETESLRTRWKDDAHDFPLLAQKGQAFPDLKDLRSLLGRAIRGGEINEDYSPTLKRLRRELEKARGRLNRKLESILKSKEVSGRLQDELVTMRNGRYVIPIRTEQRGSVDGIVHATSSSGATVFMEPLETLEMNNDIVRLAEEEAREVQRILGELTDRIQTSADDLRAAARLRAEMDVLFGIACWGREFDCVSPEFSDGALRLIAARHPILDRGLRSEGGETVPLTLEMEADERVLVISGPNAGGKTIVLKTIGLLSLMAQSGIPVPAEKADLPILDHVLADIGDQQSIANQLSTFSAHVLSVSAMVDAASERSLILLDEIGSSTEPTEGAALAVAVLEHFRGVGSLTLASTHYNRLKMYAETTDGVRNAAMEFNEATLEPTYRLIDGLAGQSSGLDIAQRLRLPSELIERARNSLDRSELDAARYVRELQDRVKSLEGEKRALEAERHDFEEWKAGMLTRLEEERRAERNRIEARLDTIVGELRDGAAKELNAAGREAKKRFDKTLDRARVRAGEQIRRVQQPVEPETVDAPSVGATPAPRAGARVRVLSLGVEGLVSDVMASEVEVTVGNMKTRRPFNDVETVAPPLELPRNVHFDFFEKQMDSTEINLIGCRAEEAISRLDKFLDDALLTGLLSVRIVHGSGMGVLRRAVSEFLESHPNVSGFELAPQNQGGGGATLVTLKD